MKQICKPNFVSAKADGNHSSGLFVAKQLERPTRKRRLISQTNKRAAYIIVFLFGLAPRGVYPAAPVTKRAGALLPHHFTHHHYERIL